MEPASFPRMLPTPACFWRHSALGLRNLLSWLSFCFPNSSSSATFLSIFFHLSVPQTGALCPRLSCPQHRTVSCVLTHSQGSMTTLTSTIPKCTSLTHIGCEVSSCGLCTTKPRPWPLTHTCPSPVLCPTELCSTAGSWEPSRQ